MQNFIDERVQQIKTRVGNKKVLCALSGGVDSSVAAVLVHKAIGDQLTCVFVDNGLLRKNEGKQVEKVFKEQFQINFIKANAQDRFLQKLEGVIDPEEKRKIIGEEFIRVFEEHAKQIKDVEFLVQGTIYPDVVESGTDKEHLVKTHHNVGGLPKDLNFTLIEPLRTLYKDEVREVGRTLGISPEMVGRQPFPGPGLAIRVLGEVTKEKLEIVREADYIYREEIQKSGLDKEIWQYFAVLPDIKSVGVIDGKRTYSHTIALRAVSTKDALVANWYPIPLDLLDKISTRITNEVKQINKVVYDITNKPPSTIEWE